jgi:hypothetical protein
MEHSAINSERQSFQDTATGRFLPGNNASPHGRGTPKVRARAKAAAYAADYRIIHGCDPTATVCARILRACILEVEAERPGNKNRHHASNAADRILAGYGLDRIPAPPAPASPPRKLDERTVIVHVEEKLRPPPVANGDDAAVPWPTGYEASK